MKRLLMIFAAAVGLLTACVNDELAEPAGVDKLAGIKTQEEAVLNSAEDLKALDAALSELDADLTDVKELVAHHIEYLKEGVSLEEAALATLDQQKKIAAVVGAVEGALLSDAAYGQDLKNLFETFHTGVSNWLGESFSVYYPVALANAKVAAVLADLGPQINRQKLYVDALVSDVQSGLRIDENPEQLMTLAASVENMSKMSESLASEVTSVAQDVEAEYRSAIKAICSAQSSFDAQELSELNASARTKAGEATSSLGDLASSVKACQETLADLQDRLGLVETELEGLLAMVQSVTFVSENSSDYAVAYYDMDLNGESTPEGYKPRIPKNTIGLTFMVRPATAASAFVDQKLWNQDIKVIGYYANRIQQAAVPTVMDFEIETVSASPETGMVSVTVKNDLSEDFFYKKTGAKLALSVATGKTDLSSKFVEIVPQDASGKIYLESIRLSEQKVELAVGETFKVDAILSPEDVSDKYVTWSSGNTNIMTVENRTLTENVVTAVSEGSTTLTVTTSGTDEWGRHLTASCPVKVNPAIRLLGPAYVEQGKTAELTLDFPPAMVVESKVWLVDDDHKDYATVADGVVTGVKDTYNSYTYDYTTLKVTCIVNGDITLTHDMKVVVPQPRQIKFNDYADDVTSVDMKLDQNISFAATILPDNVNASQFRLFYESDGGLGWVDSKSGAVKAPQTPGTRYVYANVFNVDKHHYFAPGASLRRTVVVKVHPYYVQKIEFSQPTMTLSPDQTASLSPIFTSDVTGKQPTYKDLKWVSSNPDVVSVNATTGEIKTLKEGSATITATTANTWSIPSGDNHKSASCTIVVKKPSDPVYIGDYFYSDGTWSTALNKSKVLRGIVCQTGAASATDKHLPTTCTNGYVISVEEVAAILDADANVSADKFNTWAQSHGYYAIEAGDGSWNGAKGTSAYGYSNTSAYMELTEQKAYDELGTSWSGAHYGGWDFYYTSGGLDNFRKNNPVDTSKSSNWYVPSQKEMTFVSDDVLSAVNAALSAAGKTQITNKNYKTSSYNNYGNAVVVNPVAKSATQQSVSTEGSLRFFLAF